MYKVQKKSHPNAMKGVFWPPRGGGGGGTSVLKVTGTCRCTGYNFAVINISTGYLVAPGGGGGGVLAVYRHTGVCRSNR